jgi:hypothetical protein
MDTIEEPDKKIQIDPLPEEKKEEKKKPGRPRLPEDQKKYYKKTDDTYTMTEKRKKALEKARMIKQLRKEGKIIDNVINYYPDIIDSELGNYPSAINSNPKSQNPIATEPIRYLNSRENQLNIHDASYKQLPYKTPGDVDIFSVYSNQIEELKMQIEELKRTRQMDPKLKIQYEIDDQGVSNTYRVPQQETKHDKGDIMVHSGKKDSTNRIYNENPFSVKKKKQRYF